jgi:hypothetical protein
VSRKCWHAIAAPAAWRCRAHGPIGGRRTKRRSAALKVELLGIRPHSATDIVFAAFVGHSKIRHARARVVRFFDLKFAQLLAPQWVSVDRMPNTSALCLSGRLSVNIDFSCLPRSALPAVWRHPFSSSLASRIVKLIRWVEFSIKFVLQKSAASLVLLFSRQILCLPTRKFLQHELARCGAFALVPRMEQTGVS